MPGQHNYASVYAVFVKLVVHDAGDAKAGIGMEGVASGGRHFRLIICAEIVRIQSFKKRNTREFAIALLLLSVSG